MTSSRGAAIWLAAVAIIGCSHVVKPTSEVSELLTSDDASVVAGVVTRVIEREVKPGPSGPLWVLSGRNRERVTEMVRDELRAAGYALAEQAGPSTRPVMITVEPYDGQTWRCQVDIGSEVGVTMLLVRDSGGHLVARTGESVGRRLWVQ